MNIKHFLALSSMTLILTCKNPETMTSNPNFQGIPVLERSDAASKSLVQIETSDRKLLCTGVLISMNQVLTAGHCAKGVLADNIYLVRIGIESGFGKSFKATVEKIHEKITDALNKDFSLDGDVTVAALNDIMILKLDTEIPIDRGLEPAKMSDIEPKLHDSVTYYGFGAIGDAIDPLTNQIDIEDHLLHLKKSSAIIKGHPRLGSSVTYPNNVNQAYQIAAQKMFSAQLEKNVVAGTQDVQFYTCNGDSGGGVFNDSGELVGIHVAGLDKLVLDNGIWKLERNCESGYSYFVNLSKYKKWLNGEVEEENILTHSIIEKQAKQSEPTFISKNFLIKNYTGTDIVELYAVQDYATNYGFNLLKEQMTNNGLMHLRIDDKTCHYDFLAVTGSGTQKNNIKVSLNICEQNEWEIKN